MAERARPRHPLAPFAGALLIVAGLLPIAAPVAAVSPNLVLSQVYGGGGNAGATLTNDFIEVFNRGTTAVDVSGWSVQYASSAGTSWQRTNLSGSVAAGQYLLVQEAQGAGGTVPLPAPDASGAIAMSATAGKVALLNSQTTIASGTSCPSGATLVDLVGYGSAANCLEGTGPTSTLSNTTAALRANKGCTDTDDNAADFTAGAPNPRNRLSPTFDCAADPAPSVAETTPADGGTAIAVSANLSINFSEPVSPTGAWYSISCTTSGAHPATESGGPETFTIDPAADFANSETCTVTIFATQISDQDGNDPPDHMAEDHVFSFTTEAPPPPVVHVHDVQGASHTSPMVGPVAGVVGIVTAKRSNGYYLQDPEPDADDATSEAIFVFTGSAPTSIDTGDEVRVSGTVAEFRPGGASSANLTTTEITSPTTTVLSTDNPLPAATVIGTGGRVPPTQVIEDDASGSVEASGAFDPSADGIDFYETLEHMRVQVNNPVVVGPRSSFGEIFVLADDGAGASARTARNGIVINDVEPEPAGDYASGDFNPERIQLDDALLGDSTPNASVGDHFSGPAVGVLDYDFGNFELNLTAPLTTASAGLARETTATPALNELSVATFNVENLDANEPQSKFDALAGQIVHNMSSPDVVSLEEIQDNNGATNDSVVAANDTLDKLVAAIAAAGGPDYDWRQINPVDDQDGGEPGGNIRVGFIFRTDRGLAFVDRPGGDSTTPTTIVTGPAGQPQLSSSPGRVDPGNAAWNSSRKPLAGEFTFRGETFFLITNHFNSKGGDNPLFGRFQPPVRTTETQRHQQAQIVNAFVDSILAVDAGANVIVLGDINDFEFSQTMAHLEGGVLHALMKTLPPNERYSYVFEGNSQSLDHIVVSNSLFGMPFVYDPVHVNAEFFDQLSDHDPQVARFFVNAAPSVDAGGPYTVAEGVSITLAATGTDPNGDSLTYAWDLDNDGTFETSGQTATFSAAGLDGPATYAVAVRVTDGPSSATDSVTVDVTNAAPTALLSAPATTFAGFPFSLSLTGATDPSAGDTAAGFQYAFDCGGGAGYGAFGSASTASCPTSDVGTRTVKAKVRDRDSGVTEYTASVNIVVTYDSLCELGRTVVTRPLAARALCLTLRAAEAADDRGRDPAKLALLRVYRLEVDVLRRLRQVSVENAELLKRLSTRL